MTRQARVERETRETRVEVSLELEGQGRAEVATGIPFLDHMLELVAVHGLCDLEIRAEGDLEVDYHHTVEDLGICLGQALHQALGDHARIRRCASAVVPMDEALARVTIDLGGRAVLVYRVEIDGPAGAFDPGLARVFLEALSREARCNLHVSLDYGQDPHHCLEAIFKALGRALDTASALDPRRQGIPSSKGIIEV